MKNAHLNIVAIAATLILGLSACQQKMVQTTPIAQEDTTRTVLFINFKATKTEKGMVVDNIEQSVREDYSNPRKTNETQNGETLRCQIVDDKGYVVSTTLQLCDFNMKNESNEPYTFVKFMEVLPQNAKSYVISIKINEGVWQELHTSAIPNP